MPNFYGLAGGPYPSHSSGPIWTGADTITKVWGNHTIKVGFTLEYSGENDGDQINVSTVPGGASNQNGNFTFTDARTGLGATYGSGHGQPGDGPGRQLYRNRTARADHLARHDVGGIPAGFLEGYREAAHRFRRSASPPPRDSIRFGATADYFDGTLYNPAQAVQVDPKTGNVILGTGNPYNGVVIPGFSLFPSCRRWARSGSQPATANQCDGAPCTGLFNSSFSPELHRQHNPVPAAHRHRVSRPNRKTVIRAGAGRFATRMGLLDNVFPGGNSPFQPFVTVNNVSVDNPGRRADQRNRRAAHHHHAESAPETTRSVELEHHRTARTPAGHPAVGRLCGPPRSARMAGLRHQPAHGRAPCRPTPASTSMICARTRASPPFRKRRAA